MSGECEVLVAGGGLGGVAAALSATRAGCRVVLVEPSAWLGGQMTSQGVSVLDEHALIERFGGTSAYYHLRRLIRDEYDPFCRPEVLKRGLPLNPGAPRRPAPLAFEPKVGVKAIDRLLNPYVTAGTVTIYRNSEFQGVEKTSTRISEVVITGDHGATLTLRPRFVVDATDMGDILPLAGAPYRVGVDGYEATGEPSAPPAGDRRATQAFTFTFAVEFRPGENHVIAKPQLYDELKDNHPFTLNGRPMLGKGRLSTSFLNYRRIIYADHFQTPEYAADVSLVNWISSDYHEGTLVDQPPEVSRRHLERARQRALSFLYWLQTEAPRDDGGSGYPELKLRPDVMGTADGLSPSPYIREGRRLRALHLIREQDVVAGFNPGNRARLHPDTVGIGWYPYIDIHRCCHTKQRHGSGQRLLPFQIPLGALVTNAVTNLAAGGKCLGTTHITNGAYRFHPVEWAIGEAAGALAAYCCRTGKSAPATARDLVAVRELQARLLAAGVPLFWHTDIPQGHPVFTSLQWLSVLGVVRGETLEFAPDQAITAYDAAEWLRSARFQCGMSRHCAFELRKNWATYTRAGLAGEIFRRITEGRSAVGR